MSRVHRHDGSFGWSGIEPRDYWPGVPGASRRVFVGEAGEAAGFHVRYFELPPGESTSLERHLHEHCVIVLRGTGRAVLGEETVELAFGDVVYVSPDHPHQFLHAGGDEPFGFVCVVDSERDRPRPVTG